MPRRPGGRSPSAGSTCYPNDGKRSGAYSNGGAYDVHPYMLLNYNGKYTDVSTVAHELGHTMHSYFSNKTQPFADVRLSDLRRRGGLDVQRGAAHRAHAQENHRRRGQAVAARQLPGEHQGHGVPPDAVRRVRAAHARDGRRRAQPLTGEALDKLYPDITRKYYGHDQGVCVVDDYVAHEWAFIPHFYRNYYVFQYATSFTASRRCRRRCIAGDAAATERYLAFLGAGGSNYPIDLLKDAGVDMTTDEPLDLTIKKMNRVMDEMEQLSRGLYRAGGGQVKRPSICVSWLIGYTVSP